MIIENEREVKVMPKAKCEKLENVVESGLSWFDQQELRKVDELLHTLQHKFGDYIQLQDLNTGEILDVQELARVRGILSMLSNSKVFQMSIK
jgi:hypothetical protein